MQPKSLFVRMQRKKILYIIICVLSISAIVCGVVHRSKAATANETADCLKTELEHYLSMCDAEIGVCLIIDSKDTIRLNDRDQYPMNSVMKLYQAIAVMDYMQEHELSLDSMLTIDHSELHPNTYSPLRDSIGNKGFSMPIAEIMEYSLRYSDNNACDILFNHILPVDQVERRLRKMGVNGFAIRSDENTMHKEPKRTADNWSHPSTAAILIERLFTQNLFHANSQQFLCDVLTSCSTGKNRLPKPLAGTDAIIGHKTGTGFPDVQGNPQGINDVGFVQLPNGHHYSISVFVKSSKSNMDATEQMIADISEMAYSIISMILL